jgi:hypothetical protein
MLFRMIIKDTGCGLNNTGRSEYYLLIKKLAGEYYFLYNRINRYNVTNINMQ